MLPGSFHSPTSNPTRDTETHSSRTKQTSPNSPQFSTTCNKIAQKEKTSAEGEEGVFASDSLLIMLLSLQTLAMDLQDAGPSSSQASTVAQSSVPSLAAESWCVFSIAPVHWQCSFYLCLSHSRILPDRKLQHAVLQPGAIHDIFKVLG